MNNEREMFEQAIRASPADLEIRTIFADWLEEHGQKRLATAWRWLAEHKSMPSDYWQGYYWVRLHRERWGDATYMPLDAITHPVLAERDPTLRSYFSRDFDTIHEALFAAASALADTLPVLKEFSLSE